jgi:carboxyl-terminal processing protease
MPRRNLLIIATVALVAVVCYLRTDHNRYGRYLTQVLNLIDHWALEPAPQHALFDAAVRGMVSQLDEHSTYITARDAAAFEADLEQQFGGIGVVVKLEGDDRHLTVVSPPRPGTPASNAGIRVRDWIVSIDGAPTEGLTMAAIVRRMRGPEGAAVELTVVHADTTTPVHLRVVRATIEIPSVLGDRHLQDGSWGFHLSQDPTIGYVRILNFGDRTAEELERVLERLRGEGVRGLILDLRDDPGGLLEAAVATCELFLPKGRIIVRIRGRHRTLEEVYTSRGPGLITKLPMVVLVNHYTASSAEIVAACLQDHRRARIVGQRTWGKGTVQRVLTIEGGRSLLKLTAASYWRPSGRNINRLKNDQAGDWGVTPDAPNRVAVTQQEEERRREARRRRDLLEGQAPNNSPSPAPPVDPTLDRALELLTPGQATEVPHAAAATSPKDGPRQREKTSR